MQGLYWAKPTFTFRRFHLEALPFLIQLWRPFYRYAAHRCLGRKPGPSALVVNFGADHTIDSRGTAGIAYRDDAREHA